MELFFFSVLFLILLLKLSHMLSFLVTFEMLSLYFAIIMFNVCFFFSLFYFYLMFFTVSVCESILGLVLFVVYTRYFSKDHLSGFCVLKF